MSKESKYVAFEKRDKYAIIRWNRPARKNAIIPEMDIAMSYHLDRLAHDDTVMLVVLTGTGEYYTSGADFILNAADRTTKLNEEGAREGLLPFKNLVKSFITFPKPIIVAVNGPAIGMGVTTLPLCDVVYASSDSTFNTPFSRIGMLPEACSSYSFPLVMGYAKANEMLLFNRTLSATEAYTCGLVTEIFPKETLMKEVEKRVKEFTDNPAKCLLYGKRLIRGHEIDKLLKINEEECERLVERTLSEDIVTQAMKFIQRRREIKEKRKAKL